MILETEKKEKAGNTKKIARKIVGYHGRLHGFVWNNTFNIVWFDPAHNLYPMQRGLTKHKDAAKVRCFGPSETLRLQEEIKKIQQEYEELLDAFANMAPSGSGQTT